jgi:hypothetical protein
MIKMDKKDCELGMKIRRVADFDTVDKGKYTVQFLHGKNAVQLEEIEGVYLLENFEPVNKFKEGDRVIYKNLRDRFIEVRFCGETSHGKPIIEFYHDNFITKTEYKRLQELKKRNRLEIGDKFKAKGSTFEVVAVGEDSELGTVYFSSRSLGMKTKYDIICWEKIDKIIY